MYLAKGSATVTGCILEGYISSVSGLFFCNPRLDNHLYYDIDVHWAYNIYDPCKNNQGVFVVLELEVLDE